MPTQEAILKLARPIHVPQRQHFKVEATWYIPGAQSALTLLNSTMSGSGDEKVIAFLLLDDGHKMAAIGQLAA
jgi:hypothetical protein